MSAKYQVIKFRRGVPFSVWEYDEKNRAFAFADKFNQRLLQRDGPICRAFLVIFDGELVRGWVDSVKNQTI